MESVYSPDVYHSSDHINFQEYFKDYSNLLFDFQKSITKEPVTNEEIFTSMGINDVLDDEQKKFLLESCSIEQLRVPGENEPINHKASTQSIASGTLRSFKPYKITENAKKLETVKQFLKRQEEYRKGHLYEQKLPDIDLQLDATPESTGEPDLMPGKDFVVYIRLFRPFEYVYGQSNKEAVKFDHEIALLGTNTLADFRDKIYCSSDLSVSKDMSEDLKNVDTMKLSAHIYPSGFIFVDGTFYNDFRESGSIDYSKVIKDWAESKGIGTFQTAEMKDMQIQDLTPRLGYPYVYQHTGRCEHIFMFSDARLLNPGDKLQSSVYPFYSNASFTKTIYCVICGIVPAVWLVVECDRIPKDRAPLCNDCLLSYCYVDGKKIGTFKAYPYMNRPKLV